MTTTDQTTGISVTSNFSQEVTQHTQGMPLSSVTQTANGSIINKQSATLTQKVFGSGQLNQSYYLPYVKQNIETAYDLNGTQLSVKTTTTTIDDYANPTEIVQTAQDSTGTYTTDTKNQYTNDLIHWWIGELTQAQVTVSAPDTSTITRTSSYTYDPNTGMLQTSTSYFPTNTGVDVLIKTYLRNGYGN